MSQDLLGAGISQARPNLQAGELNRLEKQWANRQATLEAAGYMLRQRYRPGWQPSWIATGKFFMDVEDGQAQVVSVDVLLRFMVMLTYDRNGWSWMQPGFPMPDL